MTRVQKALDAIGDALLALRSGPNEAAEVLIFKALEAIESAKEDTDWIEVHDQSGGLITLPVSAIKGIGRRRNNGEETTVLFIPNGDLMPIREDFATIVRDIAGLELGADGEPQAPTPEAKH